MSNKKDADKKFYGQLFSKTGWTMAIVVVLAILYVLFLPKSLDNEFWKWLIISVAILKAFLIVRITFTQLSKMLGDSHYLEHVLSLFTLIISLIVLSFASDYYALYVNEAANFKTNLIVVEPSIFLFFEFFYYSLISFATVGYGDFVPISLSAKFLVALETILYFFVLVFGTANINRINIKD
ncbi:two pore domain potassium channel family protein [Salegentibacter sp. BLCTC]|uniref:ion channel n=1 Tax=Salegentibacter sp. BLCTC TaxID=2697368 RepID=UPI00187B6F6D|nr:ion channel [Salegentibacter sp. BLCTC]MBE7640615.1 two pore domain potassium channel family protein [Salegentibacter sp. BLCTC]